MTLFPYEWLALCLETHWLTISIGLIVMSCLIYCRRRYSKNDSRRCSFIDEDQVDNIESSTSELRKRDKVLLYSKKVLRKVKSFGNSGSPNGKPKMRKRERLLRIARRMLRLDMETAARPTKRPPAAFFEADTSISDSNLPPELVYMLKNIRVFGHFEAPLFLELCKHMEVIKVPVGHTLFKPGDNDDSIYVVQQGQLTVYIKELDEEFPVKIVPKGDSVYSLLSILDVLTGSMAPFKTCSARADVDSIVLKLCTQVFNDIFEKYQESWLRVIQIIVLTLQRVTLATLHVYLGLSQELTKMVIKEIPNRKVENRHDTIAKARAGFATNRSSSCAVEAFTASLQRLPNLYNKPVGHLDLSEIRDLTSATEHVPITEGSDVKDSGVDSTLKYMAKVFGLEDESLLVGRVTVETFQPGHVLCEQGSLNVPLIYVLNGSLELTRNAVDDSEMLLSIVHCQEMAGCLAVLTGEPSFYSCKTRQFARLAIIKKDHFYELLSEKPRIVLAVAHGVTQQLSPFVRSIDFALGLEMCDAGRALYKQNDESDALYVVLSGRLRSVLTKDDGSKVLVEEYGRGDLVGTVELLTLKPRATTVLSIRYTELAKVPAGLLNLIKFKYPQVLTRIIQLLGNCVLKQHEQKLTVGNLEALPTVANLNTIAVMGVSEGVPVATFTLELWHALNSIKPTLELSSDVIVKNLGAHVLESVNEYHLMTWLSQQEDSYPIVLYRCDFELTNWSRRCIRQADCILIVANGKDEPVVGPVEKQLENLAVRAQKELIMLWDESVEQPKRTAEWLDVRGWVSSHYHLKMPQRMQMRRSSTTMLEAYDKFFSQPVDKFSDFSRLARILTGRAIGVVLGGGGARGAAHVGILKALKDVGVPIDVIGGVSIGSFVGGLFSMDPDVTHLINRAKAWFEEMSQFWRNLLDLTYPSSAIFTGAAFNSTLKNQFHDCQIEDLWIPYFNVTTDISSSEMRIHRNGEAWRYIRASMSYCGILPPMCNPVNNHYLVDGCYINNLPADVMRGLGINTVIAVDVGAQNETDLTNYGDSLSGWWVLWKKWMPFTEPVKVLNMAEIQSRLAYVSCVRQLEIVKKAPYCHYVRAPIDKYQTLDFAKYEEIFTNAYEYGKQLFEEWAKNGKLDEILNFSFTSPTALLSKKASLTRAAYPPPFLTTGQITTSSFTDLAALVSKITRPRNSSIYLSDVSEESSLSETDAEIENENTRLLELQGSPEESNSSLDASKESNVLFSAGTLDDDTTSSMDLLPIQEKCDSGIVDPPNFSEMEHT